MLSFSIDIESKKPILNSAVIKSGVMWELVEHLKFQRRGKLSFPLAGVHFISICDFRAMFKLFFWAALITKIGAVVWPLTSLRCSLVGKQNRGAWVFASLWQLTPNSLHYLAPATFRFSFWIFWRMAVNAPHIS